MKTTAGRVEAGASPGWGQADDLGSRATLSAVSALIRPKLDRHSVSNDRVKGENHRGTREVFELGFVDELAPDLNAQAARS